MKSHASEPPTGIELRSLILKEVIVRDIRNFQGSFSSMTGMKVRIMEEFREQ